MTTTASSRSAPSRRARPRRRGKPTRSWAALLRRIPGYDPIATAGNCWFDEAEAQRALDFFPAHVRHQKGELGGQPFELLAWQKAVVANLFGWKRPNGTRRYRECLLFVPKKNGKTFLTVGLALFGLFCDGEPGAEVYSAAADRDQASIIYNQAKDIILKNPALASRARVFTGHKSIEVPETGSVYRPLSADAETKHGYNVHFVIIDELHAQPNRELTEVLTSGVASRRQPLVVYITTSDYERPSICNEVYARARKVRDGLVDDPAFLPVIYEALPTDDWTSPAVWKKANPSFGVSVNEEFFRTEVAKAEAWPSRLNAFLRLHLNIRTNAEVAAIPMERWDRGAEPFDPSELEGRVCYAGLDLSATQDLTALVLLFPEEDGSFKVLPHFWRPKATVVEAERRDNVSYLSWATRGFLRLCDGVAVDQEEVFETIRACAKRYRIEELAFDRWGATYLVAKLQDANVKVVEFGQGYASLSEPSKQFERLLAAGKIRHGGHPVLRWNASNLTWKRDDAENLKPSKIRSKGRIDGIVALIMALGRAIAVPPEPPSIYETRGPVLV